MSGVRCRSSYRVSMFPYPDVIKILVFARLSTPRLLAPSFQCAREITWQNSGPTKSKQRLFPPFIFKFFEQFFVFPFSSHGYGDRCSYPRPIPQRSPLLRVRQGILWARRRDGAGRHGRQSSVLARGELPSPRGPPRHHRTELERRDLPVSGKCPGPSQNQPAICNSLKPAVLGKISAAVRGSFTPSVRSQH